MTIDEIRDQVLRLPIEERARLARDLLDSLEPHEFDIDYDAALIAEVERRADAIARGEMRLIDWRESIAEMRKMLDEKRKT